MYQLLLTIQYFSIALLSAECGFIFMKWKTKLHGILLFSCVSTLVSNVGYLLEMKAQTEVEYLRAVQFSYLGRCWIGFALFLFCLKLSNIEMKRWVSMTLAAAHIFTFWLVMTSETNNLYYSSMTYVTEGIFPHIKFGHGVWHVIYTALLIAYIFVGLTALFIAVRREKNPIARKRLILILVSIAIECVFYIVEVTGYSGCYDMTMLGYTIGAFIMCIALFSYDLLDALELAKDFVADEMPEGILVFNQNGQKEYANSIACSVFEDETEDEKIRESLENAIANGTPVYKNDRIYSPEKRELIHKNTSRGVAYVLIDDTEHYRYMEELKMQKDLAEAAKEEALLASESKSAFLSIVSHEIRTPMNAVVGMTDLMLREKDKLTDKQEKYLRNIKNSGSALVMIVNDILDQSKIEAGKMEIVDEPYELRPMVSDVQMIIDNRLGSKPIHLGIDIDDEIPNFLIGDSLRIRQILINLMNNAVKFTESGYINLSIRCVERTENVMKIRFGVKDSGQGIREEDIARLGQAFSQVDTKKNHGKEGTGLGLSISKDFIAMMGGQLEVSSVYGEGSEFFFTIAQTIADDLEETGPDGMRKQAWQEEMFTCEEAKILVVDDTEINLMIVKELLEPLKLMVETADSGETALKMLRDNRYDAVFMDYMMPYMDGVETTEKIRAFSAKALEDGDEEAAEYYKSLPVIALSGDDSDSTKERFKRAGIDDFTEKPVDLERLKKLLLKWLPKNKIVAG